MAIQLVQKEERLTYIDQKSEIYYRRISTLKRGEFVKRHTKRGKTDWPAVTEDTFLYVILGWKTVQRAGGDIVFNPDLITDLPEDTLTDILELSGGANPEAEDKQPEN